MDEFVTKGSEETKDLAKSLIPKIRRIKFVALFGNLGSGKTTFVQGLAQGLGIKERIISPTFIIVRQHRIKLQITNYKFQKFYHIDLYRLQSQKDIKELGLGEIISDKENIVAIEWAEKIKDVLPEKRIELYFENIGEDKRKITIRSYE